jgi:hypothetical protein
VSAGGRADGKGANSYFVALYQTLADALESGGAALFGIEGREHTAQVEQDRREWREWRFRWGEEDRTKLKEEKEELRKAGEAPTLHIERRRHPTDKLIFRSCAEKRGYYLKIGL